MRINYGKGDLYISDIKGISLDDFGNSDLDRFNAKYLKCDDEIIAFSNNDRIDARKGDDYVFGNNGDDTLIGGSGYDLLVGSKGIDFLAGGLRRGLVLCFHKGWQREKQHGHHH